MTRRDVLWNACRSKACCRVTRVVLTGRDLVRLVRTFELEPSQFAMHVPTSEEDPPGFLLEPRGPGYELVLRKNGEIGPAGAPCVFLVETNDGHSLCGAASGRPAACQAYPATLSEGRVRVCAGCCSCHAWSLLDLEPEERELARVAAGESDEHADVVRAWNSDVVAEGAPRSVDDFYRYLIEACA